MIALYCIPERILQWMYFKECPDAMGAYLSTLHEEPVSWIRLPSSVLNKMGLEILNILFSVSKIECSLCRGIIFSFSLSHV